MKILVTGGAGYIGSIMVKQLGEKGFEVVVFDNLSSGHKEAVEGVPLFEGDTLDKKVLESAFVQNKFEAVMHFAGVISMGESMENPYKYFLNNTLGALSLLEIMVNHKVDKLIFSSTAGVYGNPVQLPIKEDDPKNPTNPYGESKLMVEKILSWYDKVYGLRSISLRYFNAAGATLDGQFGEDHKDETHIIPLAIKAALTNTEFTIYGKDYKTKDGTCIRDYVHVIDLCQAHLLALDVLMNNHQTDFFNVGPGIGFSNIEVVEMVKKVSGVDFPVRFGERRPGDADELVADPTKIKKELGWQPKNSDLTTIIETAWKWHKAHPKGYQSYI
jgi:UDP-glucose 4-epimerase